jgi:UDPglucose 6-dehydrogenase
MVIGIIGNGIVGSALASVYSPFYDVRIWDRVPLRTVHSRQNVLQADLIFVCLPTPQSTEGLTCDLTEYHTFLSSLSGESIHRNYVFRSTFPIGTTRLLMQQYNLTSVVHSPEFLTERVARIEAHTPARHIIGHVVIPNMSTAAQYLTILYRERFPDVPIINMRSDESEAVKLFVNAFFATKITLFNEMKELSDTLDLDWEDVVRGILSDGRIAHSHTMVPGPDGRIGFGGKCLPKDLAMLVGQSGTDSLLRKVMLDNIRRRGSDG